MSYKEEINEEIIKALKENNPPWLRPGVVCGLPTNVLHKERYTGIDLLLINLTAKKYDFNSKWWGKDIEITALGGSVKSRPIVIPLGEWGTPISCGHIVYNILQTTDDFYKNFPEQETDYKGFENLIFKNEIKFKYKSGIKSCYKYKKGIIEIPPKENFKKINYYYEAFAHEIMHWTEKKVGWTNDVNKYPMFIRELRAEIGGDFLLSAFAIPHSESMVNFNKNVKKWIRALKKDPDLIFEVCESACKGISYLEGKNAE